MSTVSASARILLLSTLAGLPLPAQFGMFNGLGMGVNQRKVERQRLEYRPWIRMSATYWDNLAILTDSQGQQFTPKDVLGGMLGWGFSGGKADDRSTYVMSYLGGMRYNSQRDGISALTNVVNFGYFNQLNKNWSSSSTFYGGASAGSYGWAGGFGGAGGIGFAGFGLMSSLSPGGIASFGDPMAQGVIEDEILDNRIYFGGLRSVLIYSPNFRWQIGGGVQGSSAHRTAEGLYSMNAGGVLGQASYLIDRFTSVTGGYSMTRIWYPGIIRETYVSSALGGISRQLGRRTMLSAGGGLNQLMSNGAVKVPLAPEVAELLGVNSTIERRRVTRSIPGANFMLSHVVRDNIAATVRYTRGIVPGNGILIAPSRDAFAFSLSYVGNNRWGASTAILGVRSRSLIDEAPDYLSLQTVANVHYRLFNDFHFSGTGGYRVGRASTGQHLRQTMVNFGFTWSPGGVPFRGF